MPDVTARHGQPANPVPLDVFLSDDPDLAMVFADMEAWMDAHPCECEALCECEAYGSPPKGVGD